MSKYIKDERRVTAPQYLGTTLQSIVADGAQSIGFWAYNDIAQIIIGYRLDYNVPTTFKLRLYDVRDNEFTTYNLSQFTLLDGAGDYSSISEDKLMLVTNEGLVLYDYINDQSQILLSPDSLYCYANSQSMLLSGPYGSTIFHVDDYHDQNSLDHWYFYNSEGTLLGSEVISDPAISFIYPYYSFREDNALYFTDRYSSPDQRYVKIVVNEDFSLEYNVFEFQDDTGYLEWLRPLGANRLCALIWDYEATTGKLLIIDRSQERNILVLAEYEVEIDAYGNSPRCFATDSAIHFVYDEYTQIRIQTIDLMNPGAITEHVFPVRSFYNVRHIDTEGDGFTIFTNVGIYFFEVSPASSVPSDPSIPALRNISSYPNPARKATGFRVETKLNSPVDIGIYNVKGQLVKSVMTDSRGECEVQPDDLKGLNSGLYFLKARDHRQLKAKKIILIDWNIPHHCWYIATP